MLIQVNYGDVERSDAIDEFVREKVTKELGYLADKLTRVEVHVRDDNSAGKSSHNDKRCMMEARPANRQPLVVEHTGDDLYTVIAETAGKLSRAVKKNVERAEQ
ncbi:MAG: HPF/RaiA family ribosome-associated protein [Phycisphaeraceae bacterium]